MNTNLISDGDADPGAARGNPAHAPLSATPQDNKVFGVPTVKLGTMRGIAISVYVPFEARPQPFFLLLFPLVARCPVARQAAQQARSGVPLPGTVGG